MDEATLTIRFKDESSPGPAGVATTSPQYSGSDPGSVKVADVQNAITQAGGVGAMAEKNSRASTGGVSPASPPPVAAVAAPSVAPLPPMGGAERLLPTVQGIVEKDATVTASEIAAALGINQKQAQTLLTAATVQPGGQAGSTPPPIAPASPPSVAPAPSTEIKPPASPQSEPPVQFARPPELTREQMLSESERRAPPAPGTQPQQPGQQGPDVGRNVQSAVDSIARLASFAGPEVGAAAQALSGLSGLLPPIAAGTAPPIMAAAIPAIAAAGTAAAGVAIAVGAIRTIDAADRARSDQLAGYSPYLAVALAGSQVSQMQRDIDSAREYGAERAARTEVNTELSNSSRSLREAVSNFGGTYATGAKLLAGRLTGLVSAEQERAAWDKINAARQKTREELDRTRTDKEAHAEAIRSFVNIIPKRPSLPAKYGFSNDTPYAEREPAPAEWARTRMPGLSF